MKKEIYMTNIANESQNKVYMEINLPGSCPHCHCNYNERILNTWYIDKRDSAGYAIFVLYFCSRCEQCFLIEYLSHDVGYHSSSTAIKVYPYPNEEKEFSENIKLISKAFIKIYHQSQLAEQQGLDEICGIGYRKSLEFLIKDYAILLYPKDEDNIKSMLLSPCIDVYMDNKQIKILSKASAWIGNDETHYTRKHEDYDINSLKSFIHATVSFIDSDIEFHKAAKLINSQKN